MNVRTVMNGTNNNDYNKCNNKSQHNNECTVSRAVVYWNIFTFCLGSHVSLLFFFCSSCSRTEFSFDDRVIFISNFSFENQTVRTSRRSKTEV